MNRRAKEAPPANAQRRGSAIAASREPARSANAMASAKPSVDASMEPATRSSGTPDD